MRVYLTHLKRIHTNLGYEFAQIFNDPKTLSKIADANAYLDRRSGGGSGSYLESDSFKLGSKAVAGKKRKSKARAPKTSAKNNAAAVSDDEHDKDFHTAAGGEDDEYHDGTLHNGFDSGSSPLQTCFSMSSIKVRPFVPCGVLTLAGKHICR